MPEVPRTVIHGIDESCVQHTNLPDHGEGKGPGEGAKCFEEELLTNHVYTSNTHKWHPMEYVAFEYDFTEDGGYVGFHNLRVIVPAGTILIGGVINVIDPLTSGGAATLTIRVEAAAAAAGDVLNAAAFGGLGLGLNAMLPLYTAATGILATVDRQIKLEILGAALTAGHFYGYLTCFRSWPSEEQSSSSLSSSSESSSSESSSSEGHSSSSSYIEEWSSSSASSTSWSSLSSMITSSSSSVISSASMSTSSSEGISSASSESSSTSSMLELSSSWSASTSSSSSYIENWSSSSSYSMSSSAEEQSSSYSWSTSSSSSQSTSSASSSSTSSASSVSASSVSCSSPSSMEESGI